MEQKDENKKRSKGYFESALNSIKENKRIRDRGGYNCIPWKNFNAISQLIPGVQKSKYVIVTANSKVGKTQLADTLYVNEPISFVTKYKPEDIDLQIFYFSLEVSAKKKALSIISNMLYMKHGYSISPSDLESQYRNYILPDHILEKIEALENEFESYEQYLTIIDDIRNPFGIYKYMKEFYEENGTYEYEEIDWKNQNGDIEKRKVIKEYIPNNPNLYVIILVDHVSLFTPEKTSGGTLHGAMGKWSSDHCLELRDRYGATIVNVQQQAADSEKQQFTMKGQSIIDKIKPSYDGLGDNKMTQRDCNLMIGLFAPLRYNIREYNGYNILSGKVPLRDNYREFLVMLNRDGSGASSVNLFFDGRCNMFKELPPPDSEVMNRVYDHIKDIRNDEKLKT